MKIRDVVTMLLKMDQDRDLVLLHEEDEDCPVALSGVGPLVRRGRVVRDPEGRPVAVFKPGEALRHYEDIRQEFVACACGEAHPIVVRFRGIPVVSCPEFSSDERNLMLVIR